MSPFHVFVAIILSLGFGLLLGAQDAYTRNSPKVSTIWGLALMAIAFIVAITNHLSK